MTVRILFPTPFYQTNLIKHKEINDRVVPILTNFENTHPKVGDPWVGFVYNTMGTYEIHTDENFLDLYNEVHKHVNRFAKELHVHRDITFNCEQSWANVYKKGDYQESHFHPNFVFSAVYYAKTTPNSKIIFENPVIDMFPLQTELQTDINNTYETMYPKDGDLFIFRSYLRHTIPMHTDNDTRITIAFNFK